MDSTASTDLYRIRFEGHLPESWTEWFDSFELTLEPEGITCLTGGVRDQAELQSLLQRLRDLGLTLVEVKRIGRIG